MQRESAGTLSAHDPRIDRETLALERSAERRAGAFVRQVEEEVDIVRREGIAAGGAQVLYQSLVPIILRCAATAAKTNVDPHCREQRCNHQQQQHPVHACGYSSGAIVTFSPDSASVSTIWQDSRELG